jgi:hypothetical protein
LSKKENLDKFLVVVKLMNLYLCGSRDMVAGGKKRRIEGKNKENRFCVDREGEERKERWGSGIFD